MIHYTTEQLAAVIAIPIVTILLVWTAAIFQKNRKQWGAYDIPVVAVLIISIIRNMTILTYILFVTLSQNTINIDYCSGTVWIFNSIHTFQASSLTTLAIIGLFSVKLHRKQQHLKQFLTATHVIYHLFCLTTLCACVGVAAILAQNTDTAVFRNLTTIYDPNPCKFMPFDLDIKFNVFIIVLNVFLAFVSFIAFLSICLNHYKIKRKDFEYLKKSNSDLSDMSLSLANENKSYYDTYTIQRGSHFYDNHNNNVVWNSDVSNISTTVSSTNSRRPCLAQQLQIEEEKNRTGLETIHPVLIVCYLFYHLPLLVLCIHPNLVAPWPVAGVALWLGLVQDILIPIGLSIVDSRFCKWVSNVYKCSSRNGDDKLPHVGLDGKFRPFSSQPQSLEVVQTNQHGRSLQAVEHRFPITNGSLYTSIDGRLPVIHNYRRHKDQRGPKQQEHHLQVANLQTALRRQEFFDRHVYHPPQNISCHSCEADLCPSHSNLHHLSPQYINKQLNLLQQPPRNNPILQNKRISLSQESLDNHLHRHHQDSINNPIMRNSRNLVRLNKMRLCKSEDSLNEITIRELKDFSKENAKEKTSEQILDYSSSDDDYLTDTNNDRLNQNFDSLSSQSSYSITTEANCDFEFYQNTATANIADLTKSTSFKTSIEVPGPDLDDLNFKIKRSNSRRSVESFPVYIEDFPVLNKAQRSNSYMTLEDRKKTKLLRSSSKMSDCTHNNIRQKIKSVEYLPNSNASTVFVEDVFYFNYPNQRKSGEARNYVGSVPDLKKVFISEYI